MNIECRIKNRKVGEDEGGTSSIVNYIPCERKLGDILYCSCQERNKSRRESER